MSHHVSDSDTFALPFPSIPPNQKRHTKGNSERILPALVWSWLSPTPFTNRLFKLIEPLSKGGGGVYNSAAGG